jgi:hypothetical protein
MFRLFQRASHIETLAQIQRFLEIRMLELLAWYNQRGGIKPRTLHPKNYIAALLLKSPKQRATTTAYVNHRAGMQSMCHGNCYFCTRYSGILSSILIKGILIDH